MNKALCFTIFSTLLTFNSMADDDLSFYGRLDLAITNSTTGNTTQNGKSGTVLENNFSNLGLRGKEGITDTLNIIYQLEFQVENTTTSGGKDPFKARNTYLGLESQQLGTLLVGRNDTVFKQSEGSVDIFGNTNADIDRLVAAQTRSADAIWYYSPALLGVVNINATYLVTDNQADADSDNEQDRNPNVQYALNITLGDKKFREHHYYLAAAFNKGIADVDAYRGVAQIKLGQVKLASLYQYTKSQKSNEQNMKGYSYFLNLVYEVNGINLKAEYGTDTSGLGKYFTNATGGSSTVRSTFSDVKVTQLTIGADYPISQTTLLYGHIAQYQGHYQNTGALIDLEKDNVFTTGVRYNF